jgi:hypothetical protein
MAIDQDYDYDYRHANPDTLESEDSMDQPGYEHDEEDSYEPAHYDEADNRRS